jgi:ATP-dependent protease ClpP protease subunit
VGEDSDGTGEKVGKVLIYSGEISWKFHSFMESALVPKLPPKLTPTHLVLNSYGGDVCVALSLVDWLEMSKGLATVATGACMSAAVPIIAAGKKGQRFATPRTRFMLHTIHGYYDQPLYLDYLDKEKKEFEVEMNMYAEIMARHTGTYDLEWWKKTINTDPCKYFSAEEAIELGIIDAVMGESRTSPIPINKTTKRRTKKTKKTKKRKR